MKFRCIKHQRSPCYYRVLLCSGEELRKLDKFYYLRYNRYDYCLKLNADIQLQFN